MKPASVAWMAHTSPAVRQRYAEALARRAAGLQGLARQRLDERLTQWQCSAADTESRATVAVSRPSMRRHATPSLLSSLLNFSAGPITNAAQAAAEAQQPPSGPPELKAISEHRATWTRLHMEQRLSQALARVPSNAGPLNTQRLVHEALAQMRVLSPDYLYRTLVQVEALLWLDGVNQAVAKPSRKA